MASLQHMRLATYLVYLTVLFGILLWVYTSLTHFDAMLRLEAGKSEHILYVPADDTGSAILGRQALPVEVIPFDIESTARYLSNEHSYVTRALPFSLGLTTPSTASVNFTEQLVEVSAGTVHTIEPGSTVQLKDGHMKVLGFSPWQGLAPSPRGVKCAALVVTSGDNQLGQPVQLEAGRWALVDEKLAMGLQWHATEQEARSAAEAQTRPGLQAAWWTVKDGDAVIRSTSFLPGAGTECSDGSVWTVEQMVDNGAHSIPTLQLRVEEKAGTHIESIPANDRSGASRVRFHHPGAAETLLVIHAWRENEALVSVLTKHDGPPSVRLADLEGVATADGRRVWLTEVLPYALPVPQHVPNIQQVVVEDEHGRRAYLREGGRAVLAGSELSYSREIRPGTQPVHLEVINPPRVERRQEVLPPEKEIRVGEWRISLATMVSPSRDPNGVYLRVRYQAFTPERTLGILLFLAGSYGWVLIRFRPSRKQPQKEAKSDFTIPA